MLSWEQTRKLSCSSLLLKKIILELHMKITIVDTQNNALGTTPVQLIGVTLGFGEAHSGADLVFSKRRKVPRLRPARA